MRAKLFQIAWHPDPDRGQNLPVYSIDAHPVASVPILATAGADREIKIWRLAYKSDAPAGSSEAGKVDVDFLFSIAGLDAPVNCIRFSPNGQCLAAGLDGGHVFVFYPRHEFDWSTVQLARHLQRVRLNPNLGSKGHSGDVYDLSWSPDSKQLVSGAVDNSAVVWDVVKDISVVRLEGHTQYVQGVAWDPAGAFIATQSNDRSVRVFKPASTAKAGKAAAQAAWTCAQVISKREQTPAVPSAATAAPATAASTDATVQTVAVKHPMFADESVVTFFRRLAWSPDGTLLIAPAGIYRCSGGAAAAASASLDGAAGSVKGVVTTYLFSRDRLAAPIAHLPGTSHSKASVCVRVSPVLYELREGVTTHSTTVRMTSPMLEGSVPSEQLDDSDALLQHAFQLPYRMYIAIATLDSVLVYDTQRRLPVAVMAGFHVDKITDMAWSANGEQLFVASIDGYVSCAAFAPAELGTPLAKDALPPACRQPQELTFVAKQAKSGAAEGEADIASSIEPPAPAPDAASTAVATGAPTAPARKRITPEAVPTSVNMLTVPAVASPPRNVPASEAKLASPGKRRIVPIAVDGEEAVKKPREEIVELE